MAQATLYYAHDPMCSWCYGFNATWQKLQKLLSERFSQEQLHVHFLAGGLAPDSDQPMPQEMRARLEATWHRIAEELGTTFNYDFWRTNVPRRSTYNACRAALLARQADKEAEMIAAIQAAYYLQARNPSDVHVLAECAIAIGLDGKTFANRLRNQETQDLLTQDIALARRLGLDSFPSFALAIDGEVHPIPLDYHSADNMLHSITERLGKL